jgi:hypothetical protein
MKPHRTARGLLLLSMTALAFIAGAATAIVRGWGSPLVTVEVVNKSGADLRAVLLEVDTCGSKQQIPGGALRVDASTRLRFLPCGEAGYRLSVVLADGVEMRSEGYAEAGYRIVEVVESRRVRSETRTHRL